MQGILRPDDVVFAHDFVTRSTLTATRPLSNLTLMLPELETTPLAGTPRLVYLESSYVLSQRAELARRMAARGYPELREWLIPAGDGRGSLTEWRILTFSRR